MFSKRGQISLEYVMIVGAVLLITIPLFFYAIYETNYKIRLNQADDAVNTLANAADTVYSMGPGSKKYVWVSIPSGVTSSLVNDATIQLTLSIFGGSSDIHASSKAVLVGSVPTGKGTYRIAVEALEAGIVRIGEDYTDTTPPVILRTYPYTGLGQTICPGFITLGADTDEPATCKYDTIDPPQTPEAYNNMFSNFDGRGLTHTSTVYVDTGQSKTYYARCRDSFGNTMTTSSVISFTTGVPCGVEGTGNLSLNLSDDIGPPEVHLIAPPDWSIQNFSWVDFYYNVTDINNSITYCLLVAEGLTDELEARKYFGWDSQPQENVTQNMTVILDKGNYTWYVNCTDDSTNLNTGQSETWNLRVNRTLFESFLNSCAGVCGFAGYQDGVCRQNTAQCTVNGEVYYSSGDEKCRAGPTGDYCCCVP